MRNIFFVLSLFLAVSCATTYNINSLTQEEKNYLSKVDNASRIFEVDQSLEKEAWSRGNSFIVTYSNFRIQSSNDMHIATYDPNSTQSGGMGYELLKEVNGKKVKFTIHCMVPFLASRAMCDQNEKIMAHYMATGEINPKFVNALISKSTMSSSTNTPQ